MPVHCSVKAVEGEVLFPATAIIFVAICHIAYKGLCCFQSPAPVCQTSAWQEPNLTLRLFLKLKLRLSFLPLKSARCVPQQSLETSKTVSDGMAAHNCIGRK